MKGGTPLFRFTINNHAFGIFKYLGQSGVFVRHFPGNPLWLRFGIPGNDSEFQKLEQTLQKMPSVFKDGDLSNV